MEELYVDPEGHYALHTDLRTVELWTVVPILFDRRERPDWQQRAGGAVARLHAGLRAIQPAPGDVLVAAFTDSNPARPDVENRLFTNVKEASDGTPKRTPNPFTHLPRSIVFERRFDALPPPVPLATQTVHYRYALQRAANWSAWKPESEPLATWSEVPASRLSEGAGWPIWLDMAAAGAHLEVAHFGAPLAENFAIELTIHTYRPLQVVTVMEAIVDGVIASFQRETDPRRARRVVHVLRGKPKLAGLPREALLAAQMTAPAILAGPPWSVNQEATWAQLSPADRWVVAGRVTVSLELRRATQALTGRLLRVRPC